MTKKYTDLYFNKLIMDKLEEENIHVTKFENGGVVAEYGQFTIEIYHERCMCHGGRLTIVSNHCGFYKRLEYPCYREDLGIVDADTELEYEILNEMIPTIKTIKEYVYCYKEKSSWNYEKDKWDYSYYKSLESISYRLFEKKGMDLFVLQEPYTKTFPNENIIEIVTPTKFENGIKYFEINRYNRKDKNSEWVLDREHPTLVECYVFNKLK